MAGIRLTSQTVLKTNKTIIIICPNCFKIKFSNPFLETPVIISGEVSANKADIIRIAIDSTTRLRLNQTFPIPEKSLLLIDRRRIATARRTVEIRIRIIWIIKE